MKVGDLRIHRDLEALSEAAAARWVQLAEEAVAARGGFHVALSGGSTPRRLYERLAEPEIAEHVPWDKVHIYFGDERTVPPEHADSNYRMAQEALLSHVPVRPEQVYRIEAEQEDPNEAAHRYAQLLASQLPMSAQGVVRFDLLLLGVGNDGHIASLFPATPILHDRARLAAAVYVEELQSWRVSVTLPVIDHARHVMMLVAGEAKAPIIHEIFTNRNTPPYPVQLIHPEGFLEWYLDEAAGQGLPGELRH